MQSQESPSQMVFQENIASPSIKRHRSRKIIFICTVLLLIFLTAGAGIVLFSQQKNTTDTSTKKNSKESLLDNPLVLQLAEKMPIPKITMVPITPAQTTAVSQPQFTGQQANSPTGTVSADTLQPSHSPTLPQAWKTYINTSLNFSISYPAELTAKENSLGFGVWDISFARDGAQDQNASDYKLLIYPRTIGKLIGQDFDQLYLLPAPSTQLMSSEGGSPQQFTKISNKTIGGLRSFDFQTTSHPPDPNVDAEIGVYIEIEGSTLIISTGESNKVVLDYMLSTFK